MKLGVYLFVAIALQLVSCNGPHVHQADLKTVDSIAVVVDDLSLKLDSAGDFGIAEKYPEIRDRFNKLLEFEQDPEDRRFWIDDMNFARRIKKSGEKYMKTKDELKEGLDYSRNQLKTLRNSIEDKKISQEQIDQYLLEESQAVRKLHRSINWIVPELRICYGALDTMVVKLDNKLSTLQAVE